MALNDSAQIGATTVIEGPTGDSRLSVVPTMVQLLREREEARTQAHAAAETIRQLEAFLGIASHELHGPATSSSLGVQLAAKRMNLLLQQAAHSDAALASQLAAVQNVLTATADSLDRLTRLMSDLLDVSRLQSCQLAVQPARADLLTLVRAAVDEQRQLAPTRRIRLHLPPARREIPVWADADRIHQVMTNLLTNALKYAPADRRVDVRVRVQADWVRVGVRDQGPGLPAEEHKRIWEAFHRAGGVAVTGRMPHGSAQSLGLGLFICKTIIEQHQGQVGVRSAPGRGSTFWFSLPVMSVERMAQDGAPPVVKDAA